MLKKYTALLSLLLLLILFGALVVVNNKLLSQFRIDLTEDNVYSLSSGSLEVINDVDEPITLYFFFSDTATKGMTSLRNYAARVQSLLEEYESRSNGKIQLQIVDPVPFSEAEDQAARLGLTGATVGNMGEAIYFGLAGTNSFDDQFTIGFFDPQKERFLEYDISKLVYQLSDPDTINVTLLTDLPVAGGQNPMTGQNSQPMTFYTQLTQLYDVETIGSDVVSLPQNTDVLVIAHPQNLSEDLLYAIDQYAMSNGRILLFVDPLYESDMMAQMGMPGTNQSSLPLLQDWGILLDGDNVVLDARLGLDIRGPDGGVIRHPGIIGLTSQELNAQEVVTANLESMNLASVGSITLKKGARLNLTPLASSSADSALVSRESYAANTDPSTLWRGVDIDKNTYTIAARITGKATSAYKQRIELQQPQFLSETSGLNLIVVADADVLADRFWVQQTAFFGQTVFTPFAGNGDFIINSTDNLTGSDALISVRSRGTYARPFTQVQALEVQAEAKFREQEEQLQQQLAETESQLQILQQQQGEASTLALTAEQQQAIDEFMAKRLSIRKSLREVRFQLQRDIDKLGNQLKLINIAIAPIILVVLLWLLSRLFRRRAGSTFAGGQ